MFSRGLQPTVMSYAAVATAQAVAERWQEALDLQARALERYVLMDFQWIVKGFQRISGSGAGEEAWMVVFWHVGF